VKTSRAHLATSTARSKESPIPSSFKWLFAIETRSDSAEI
jgi:hypothetical protein